MRRILILVILGLLLCPPVVMADTADTGLVVSVDAGVPVDGNALIDKANNMADSLHKMAMQVSIPLVIVIVIAGVALGIFFEAARKMALFAVIALVIIYWAPLLVKLVVSWIS